MLTRVYSAATSGVDAILVEIEVHVAGWGSPKIIVVGLPDIAVRESKDRVTTAIANSGYRWPRTRTTINLAPADIKKEGPSFDLPIAIGMIAAAQKTKIPDLNRCVLVGELALNGEVRPVKGILSIALEAKRQKMRAIMVPHENVHEAAIVEGIEIYSMRNLRETYRFLINEIPLQPIPNHTAAILNTNTPYDVDFSEVRGQHQVKRAIEVAVAGEHNLLLVGPPGSGKSMLAKRIPTILPPLTLDEAIATTKIHSISGLLRAEHSFVARRPFRSPHHTISDAGLMGGSSNPLPGEVSLAHNGVLFLDEIPEFKRSTLETLRQPIEDRTVTISRASGTVTFPSNFMLVAAMNPCPCGHFGNPKRECRCSPAQVERYRQRISGPLLDRIDIQVEAPAVEYQDLASDQPAEPSHAIQQRILTARKIQHDRLQNTKSSTNARMNHASIKRYCKLDSTSSDLLRQAMEELHFSARAYDRILKVARTIADIDNTESIQPPHLMEAIQFRSLDRTLWV